MVHAEDGCVRVTLTRSDDADFRKRIRLWPGKTVVKIGRAPECKVQVTLPGVSVFHAEIRAVEGGPGEEAGVFVRDLSTNGTGLQLPGGKKTWLKKGQDVSVPDRAMLVIPMNTKKRAGEDKPDAFRIWLTVSIDTGEQETPCLLPTNTVLMPSARAALLGEKGGEEDAAPAAKTGSESASLAQPSESKKMKSRAGKKSRKAEQATQEEQPQGHLASPQQTAVDEDPLGVEDMSGPAPYARAKGRARKRAASPSPVPGVGQAALGPASGTPVSPTVSQKTSPSKSAGRGRSKSGGSSSGSSSPSTKRRRKRRSRSDRAKAGKAGRTGKAGRSGRRSRSRSRGRRRRSRSRSHNRNARQGKHKSCEAEGSGQGQPMLQQWPGQSGGQWPGQSGGQWPWPGGMSGGMGAGMGGGMAGGMAHQAPWAQWAGGMGAGMGGGMGGGMGFAPGPAPPPHFDPMKQQIYFMYQRFNPMKLPQLDSILEKYKGIEHKLLQALTAKYLCTEAIAPQP